MHGSDWLRVTTLVGPITELDGELTLLIPLAQGGRELIECSHGIAEVQGDFLKVIIPQWHGEKLQLRAGILVEVDNRDGKFNIRAAHVQ